MSARRLTLVCLGLLAAAPVQATEPASRLFVLAVGINAYPAKERLSYAVKDARDVSQILRSKGRKVYRDVEVKLLTNQEADRQGILDGLAWLQREVTARDTAVIFYSGHGARHPKVGFFLVPARFKDERPLHTMVSGIELKRAAKSIRGPVVVMLDCCHAGAILNEPQAPTALRQADLAVKLVLAMEQSETAGLAILCASRGREESEERDAIHHGTFTKVVLNGLAGKADRNGDGVVTLGEIERFVKERLPKASKGQQHAVSTRSALPPTTPLAKP